jgi:putative copper export protein
LVLRLLAQSLAMNGQPKVFDLDLISAILRHTTWGVGWHIQLLGVIIAGIGFYRAIAVPATPSRSSTGAWLVASMGALTLAFSAGLAGHAAAAPRFGALMLIADGLHIVGGGGWLGSLTVVLAIGVPAALALPQADRGPTVAALIHAFSPTALAFATVIAVTGLFAGWIHLGTLPALWQTPYGSMLFRKLVILSVALAAGAYNWLRVRPRLGHDDAAITNLRRSATVEIVVGVAVLFVTAILVAMPTAMDMKM